MVLITTIALFNLLPGVNKNFLLLIPPVMDLLKLLQFSDKTALCPKKIFKEGASLILNVFRTRAMAGQNHRNHSGFVLLLVIDIRLC